MDAELVSIVNSKINHTKPSSLFSIKSYAMTLWALGMMIYRRPQMVPSWNTQNPMSLSSKSKQRKAKWGRSASIRDLSHPGESPPGARGGQRCLALSVCLPVSSLCLPVCLTLLHARTYSKSPTIIQSILSGLGINPTLR